ncbi:MAG: alkylmercury lyase family protein [Sporichthyaceae bacterium]
MLLTLLSVYGCPNAQVLLDRAHEALDARPAHVRVVEIENEAAARRWGMTGSPTLLVNGLDPFTSPGTQASMSCRLHRSPDGTVAGAPSVAELRAVLAAATPIARGAARPLDLLGRDGRGRLAAVEGGMRAVQRALLEGMAASGSPPTAALLDRIADPFGRPAVEVLRDLAAQDFVTLDHTGSLQAIYPFSTRPTRHRVLIENGPQVWAMCAVDALGIAPMLRRAVTVDTTDEITEDPISVQVASTGAVQSPAGSAVFLGRRTLVGPAEQVCCDAINMFASAHSATRWAALHAPVTGEICDVDEAAGLGRAIFGGLLTKE